MAIPRSINSNRFIVLLAAGVFITIATGFVYGRLSQRWGSAPDLVAAAKHLEQLPTQIGDWQLLHEQPTDEAVLRMLSCVGHVHRQYINRQSGETVNVAIIVGPAGPTSVHTPEICYSSRAYTISEPRRRATVSDADGRMHSLWFLTFRPEAASIDRLRVYYAWTADGTWLASESPRFEFGWRPLLYKLQLSSLISPAIAEKGTDPCQKFVTALLKSGWRIDG